MLFGKYSSSKFYLVAVKVVLIVYVQRDNRVAYLQDEPFYSLEQDSYVDSSSPTRTEA